MKEIVKGLIPRINPRSPKGVSCIVGVGRRKRPLWRNYGRKALVLDELLNEVINIVHGEAPQTMLHMYKISRVVTEFSNRRKVATKLVLLRKGETPLNKSYSYWFLCLLDSFDKSRPTITKISSNEEAELI